MMNRVWPSRTASPMATKRRGARLRAEIGRTDHRRFDGAGRSTAATATGAGRLRRGCRRRGDHRHASTVARDADAPLANGVFDLTEPGFIEQRRQRTDQLALDLQSFLPRHETLSAYLSHRDAHGPDYRRICPVFKPPCAAINVLRWGHGDFKAGKSSAVRRCRRLFSRESNVGRSPAFQPPPSALISKTLASRRRRWMSVALRSLCNATVRGRDDLKIGSRAPI